MSVKKLKFEQLIPNSKEWPINKFSNDRISFSKELIDKVIDQLYENNPDFVDDLIEKAVYLENRRVKYTPWKVDPIDDKTYWKNMTESVNNTPKENGIEYRKQLLRKIVGRYAEEILGNFNPKTHNFARKFLYRFLNIIYNKSFFFTRMKSAHLDERINLSGYVDEVRTLFGKGTVVLLPTHYSNLDSVLIGFMLDYTAGLPAFSYGAGLNLFDYEIPAHYMNQLGAYKIDRRKKNAIYQMTLLTMSSMALQRGVNSLFFPGGGRSRSGSVEKTLKVGLLSSLIDAQREMLHNNSDKKIIIVPVTFGYHFVLEAENLIEQYLKAEGRAKYTRTIPSKKRKWLLFLRKLWTKKSEVYLRLGKPIDVLGYEINKEGESIDQNGNPINLTGYFEENGSIGKNAQRESIYTKKLAKKVLKSFAENNIVLSSHLLAYIVFNYLIELNPEMEIYAIVNLNLDELSIPYEDFKIEVDSIRLKLIEMEKLGKLKIEPIFHKGTEELILKGIQHIGLYHKDRTIYHNKISNSIASENFKLLYYYYNKLGIYNLK